MSLQCTYSYLNKESILVASQWAKVKHFNYSNPRIQQEIIIFILQRNHFSSKGNNAFLKMSYIIDEWQIPMRYKNRSWNVHLLNEVMGEVEWNCRNMAVRNISGKGLSFLYQPGVLFSFFFLLCFTQLSPESPLLSISLLFCGLFIFHSNHPQNPKFCLFFFFGWRSHKVWKLIIFLQALCAQTKIPFLVLTYHHFVKKVSTFGIWKKKVKTLWENIQTGEKQGKRRKTWYPNRREKWGKRRKTLACQLSSHWSEKT